MTETSETERLAALARLSVLDTDAEPQFDTLAKLVAGAFGASAALITLVSEDREWFKAGFGAREIETPRAGGLGDVAIARAEGLVVADAAGDARFAKSPLVAEGFRFYAGAPLTTPGGHRVGVLCVMDRQPRETFSAADGDELARLAGGVMQALLTRAEAVSARASASAAETERKIAEARHSLLMDNATDLIVKCDGAGRILFASPSARRWGYDALALVGRPVIDYVHPDDLEDTQAWLGEMLGGEPQGAEDQQEIRCRNGHGEWIWFQGSPAATRDAEGRINGFIVVLRDITEARAARLAMAESEARFRVLTEQSSDIIIRTSADGRIEYISPACRLLGFDETEMVGRSTVEFLDPADHELAATRYQDLLGGRVRTPGERQEYRALRKDGGRVLLEGTSSVIRGDLGEIIGTVSHLRDVTDLRAREASFRILFDDNPLPMLVIDSTSFDIVQVNEAAVGAYGWGREDLRSVRVTEFLAPGDREVATIRLSEIDRPNEPKPYMITDGKGREREVLPFIRPTVFDGRPALLAAVLDVTDQKAAEAALARSEAQYRLLAENATDVIASCDLEGKITYVSPSAEQLYGYTTAELIGSDAGRLIHPDDRAMVRERLREMIVSQKTDASISYELRVVKKAGETIWVEANPSVICDPVTGRVIALQDCLRDISLRKAMEDELLRKRAEAEAAAVAKAEFLSNMSHELRTPLTGIIGFGGLLEAMPNLPERARTYASRLVSGGEALLAVINDILDFTKLEAGQVSLDPHPFDPVSLVSKSIHLVQTQARRKGLQLRADLDPALPARLTADGDRIRQVLLNLLSNAIKFTAKGEVTVAVSYEATDGGGRLRCRVTDTGIGVPGPLAHRLFQRFSQIDGSISREYGGTGLGLAISKGLVEMMGGEIGVDSVEGAGSTFWFTVAATVAAPEASAVVEAAADSGPPPLRILVVDDVAMNRELIIAMLEPIGAQVVEAGDGLEAVTASAQTQFDLILMDLQMPGLDGYAATRAIRSDCQNNHATPIVAISANVLPKHIAACREAGMDDYIAKPIDQRVLLAKIKDHAPPVAEPPPLRIASLAGALL